MLELRLNSAEILEPNNGLQITKGGTVKKADSSIVSGEVIIPEGVRGIGSGAFTNNTRITKVIIPEGCKKIGSSAFFGCTSLVEVSLPDSIISIGESAFANAPISRVNISPRCASIGTSAFRSTSLESVVLPDSIVHFSDAIFSNCHKLKQVKLPKNLTVIGQYSFLFCKSLEEIEIPNTVQKIGMSAFAGCTSLATLNLPEGLVWIGDGAFSRCLSLRSVRLPSSVEAILKSAFENCKNLADINMPAGLRQIESFAFKGCKNLKPFRLPESIMSISLDAFEGVLAGSEIIQGSTIKRDGMSIIGSTVISGQECSSRVSIPEGIKTLGARSFSGNTEVTSLELPDSFLRAELFSLLGCNQLADIILPLHYVRFSDAFRSLPALQSIRFSAEDPILRRPYGRVGNLDFVLGSETADAFEVTTYRPHLVEYALGNPDTRMVFVALYMLLFIRNHDNPVIRQTIFENLLVFLEDASQYHDEAFLSALTETPGFLENLDNAIAELSRKKEHDAVAFLMDFKSKRFGFRSTELEDDDLI